ncbi:MAG TPA: response regulator transcription factor [Micropepsaceae bacterium]|jgi:two-component system phosphate regulon response regulator OmpR
MATLSEASSISDIHILLVDDDGEIRAELSAYLGAHGFQVSTAANGAEAERHLMEHRFDIMLLDLWLGSENGFDVLRRLRQLGRTPCIMVTAQDEITDKIVGLELGADDYMVKPVNLRELLARIRALIRRSGPPDEPGNQPMPPAGNDSEPNWKFDPMRRSLSAPDGTQVPLTTAECDLLIELVSKEGLPQTRDELCRRVFNREWSPYDRSLDGIIVKLRRKLEPNPDNPLVIKTVRGRGYVFTGFVR